MSQHDHRPSVGAELDADADARAVTVVDRLVARHGAPSLDHYRAVYASIGLPWPGDDEIRRLHPVAIA